MAVPVCVCVSVADCSDVTSKGLECLNSSSGLRLLSLTDLPRYWLTDAKLQALHGCSRLQQLQLGDRGSPIQTNITTAAVAGSVRLHTSGVNRDPKNSGPEKMC